MEIVIKIPDEKYKALQKYLESGCTLGLVDMAILNGVILPKGHGELVDKREIYMDFGEILGLWGRSALSCMKPIVPADKEDSNEHS